MTLHVYDYEQGSDEWLAARRGILTASVVGQFVTTAPAPADDVACPECKAGVGEPCISRARKEPSPIKTFHPARTARALDFDPIVTLNEGDTARALTHTLAAERITDWSDPVFVNSDMMRGTFEEPIARDYYAQHHAPVVEAGFFVRDEGSWLLGYSPDGLVGDDGLIEIKSRRQKKHLQTILTDEVPPENMAQLQAGLLVTGRAWIDYVSFCGGMPLYVKRVHPDPRWFGAIERAARRFEADVAHIIATFHERTASMPPTERTNFDAEVLI